MQEMELKIEGMMCEGCENRVKNALKTISGVENVEADHTTGVVKVTAKEEVEEKTVEEKLEDLGYEVVKE